MAHASALGRCTHHLAGQQTMPSAGDAFVCSAQATHCAPRADIGWAGGSGVVCRHWRRHLGGSLPLFSGVNALAVALAVQSYSWQSNCLPGNHSQTLNTPLAQLVGTPKNGYTVIGCFCMFYQLS